MLKECCRCHKEKDLSEFYNDKTRPSGKAYACKSCRADYLKVRRDHKVKECANYSKIYKMAKKLGLTFVEVKNWFNKQWMKQQAQCAICGKVFCDDDCIDHDHITLKLRGLLCNHCNLGIGFLQDSSIICKNAKNYLEDFNKER